MKKSTILILIICALIFTSCRSSNSSNNKDDKKIVKTETKIKNSKEKKSSDSAKNSEEELQVKKGVNGDIPELSYKYEDLVNDSFGLYQVPNVYEDNYNEKMDNWRGLVLSQLKKIDTKLPEDASDEEVKDLFKRMHYIAGYDYMPLESIDRFSYVVFKEDGKDPFTDKNLIEDSNINVEIVLDCSGSMAKQINGKTMMEIAKNSIMEVLESMPSNAKVGLRVFGHKGNNTNSGKELSCSSNELIYPISNLNIGEIEKVLSPLKPTGWTSISDSIQKGSEDLKDFKGEKDLNILYIITDGIETCGKDPRTVASDLKSNNTNIVLGIIGFNVDSVQNQVLREISNAADGYYANAKDAPSLTSELQNIHELAFSDYKWEELTDEMINKISSNHQFSLLLQKNFINGLAEKTSFYDVIRLGSDINDSSAGLYKYDGKVYKKLLELAEQREKKVDEVLGNKYNELVEDSENYINSLQDRKNETVSFIPMTSRINPNSEYFNQYGNQGGTLEESKEDANKLENEVNPKN